MTNKDTIFFNSYQLILFLTYSNSQILNYCKQLILCTQRKPYLHLIFLTKQA